VIRSARRERRRSKARRLSLRGRATLAGAVVGSLFVLFTLGYAGSGPVIERLPDLFAASTSSISEIAETDSPKGLPPVSAGFLPVREAPPLSPAPPGLLERLPISAADYGSTLRIEGGLDPAAPERWVETVSPALLGPGYSQPLRVEYSFDAELTRRTLKVLSRGRVRRGHVIVIEPHSGRVLAYVSTDADAFPPNRAYPAASLIKVVTAAAALHHVPDRAREPCLYRGNKYRLSRSRVHRPKSGNTTSLERALATSNNQCFAQLAVDVVGSQTLLSSIANFGWLEPPAPGHAMGTVDVGDDEYDLGRLGCGLSGCRITPLHAVQLAASLVHGQRVTPWWVDRVVDEAGRELALPPPPPPRRIMSGHLAAELRGMLVRTTTRGTARSAFRTRRGKPKLGPIKVAGKTGNITGNNPSGRYEWFIGVAPADEPTVAVAVLQVQDNLWWAKSSQIGADVLQSIFCEGSRCDAKLAGRFTSDLGQSVRPILLSSSEKR